MRAVEKLLTTKRLLAHLSRDYAPVAMYQSFCPADIVLAHLIYSDLVHTEYKHIKMFTIDTGRTPDEIYLAIEDFQRRYGDVLKVYHPEASELQEFDLENGFGDNYYKRSTAIRFYKPLKRALVGHKAWISNITIERTQHTGTKGNTRNPLNGDKAWISWDPEHQLPCFNPMARWTQEEIRNYARHHGLNLLADSEQNLDELFGYTSRQIYYQDAVGLG